MKRLGIFLFILFFSFSKTILAYSSNPREFVDELVNEAISILSDKNLNKQQKIVFVEKIALENVDIKALALYTLGVLRKSSSDEDIKNYQNSFEKYFLKSLTSRLTDYSSSKFEILGDDKKSANTTIINSTILSIFDTKIFFISFFNTIFYFLGVLYISKTVNNFTNLK